MAKLKVNPLLLAIQGRIGDLVIVHEGGQMYVRRKPKKLPGFRSAAQLAQTSRFAVGSRWARTVLTDPAVRALYQKACQGHLTPHNIAVKDYLHPPVVHAIDLDSYSGHPGDVIRIRASDDFHVEGVAVQILTVGGEMLEAGQAEWDEAAGCWLYVSRVLVPPETTILTEVAAIDLPGNRGTGKACAYVGPSSLANPLNG
jgi:hypothetical protein